MTTSPDISTILSDLAELGKKDPDNPKPILVGSFAFYPTPEGGVMAVTNVPEGDFKGVHHHRITPAMIRAAVALASGGSPFKKIKGALGIGRSGQ